eukprot:m.250542 g.250542  ORF g.250542 m.250542 type:complete len:232 (+) comp15439_c0_seq3:2954-3649(+)
MTVNTVDADGHTTLHVACKYGHVAIVRDLLDEAQANPCAETARQQTPLHFACQYNHADVVELLIQHGVSLNAVDGNGATSLHYCASNGHIEAAKLLVGAGAQVDIQDARGNTCLHLAAKWSRVELARLLIIAGADCSIQNNIDKSPADECVNLVIQDMIAGALAGERPQLPTGIRVCVNMLCSCAVNCALQSKPLGTCKCMCFASYHPSHRLPHYLTSLLVFAYTHKHTCI